MPPSSLKSMIRTEYEMVTNSRFGISTLTTSGWARIVERDPPPVVGEATRLRQAACPHM